MGQVSKRSHPYTSAVILAAGAGTRFSDVPGEKQNLLIGDLPVVALTLRAFDACELIDETVLVCRADDAERYRTYADTYGLEKPFCAVVGGDDRMASAEAGVCAVSDRAKFVAVHDGVRCLIRPEDISSVVRRAYDDGAAAAGHRSVDTVKISRGGKYIDETVDRSTVWLIGTPQVFGANMYRAALYMAKRDKVSVTDDCMMAERLGFRVSLVDVGCENFKITTKTDALLAKCIIGEREKNK